MDKNTTILTYHSIGTNTIDETGAELYAVSERKFKEQMEYVKEMSRKMTDEGRGTKGENSPARLRWASEPLITFDDGDETNYTKAYPVLKEKNLKAYFFILVSKIGTTGYMNWGQIKELRDAGMIIGSHGMTHRILTVLKDEELDYELKASKKILEDNLRDNIDYFSIPRGFYNATIIDKVWYAGYKKVFTSRPKEDNGFKVGRISVRGDWNFEYYKRVLNNSFSIKDKARELLKDSAKRVLGAGRYDRIRTKVLASSEGRWTKDEGRKNKNE